YHIFTKLTKLRINFIIYHQLSCIYNAHVHAGLNGMIQEHRMHSFTNRIITSEGERQITYTTTYSYQRHQLFNTSGSIDKVYRITIMLLQSCSNGKNVRIEYDILRFKSYFFCEYFISPMAYFYFTIFGIGLPFFIKSHYHYGGSIVLTDNCLFNKFFFSFL